MIRLLDNTYEKINRKSLELFDLFDRGERPTLKFDNIENENSVARKGNQKAFSESSLFLLKTIAHKRCVKVSMNYFLADIFGTRTLPIFS